MNSRLDSIKDWKRRAKQAKYRVSSLAEHCKIDERHLRRYFISKFACSPHHWITERKLESALSQLSKGHPVKEVATAAGFSHASNFSRQFKQFYHAPPSSMRNGGFTP